MATTKRTRKRQCDKCKRDQPGVRYGVCSDCTRAPLDPYEPVWLDPSCKARRAQRYGDGDFSGVEPY